MVCDKSERINSNDKKWSVPVQVKILKHMDSLLHVALVISKIVDDASKNLFVAQVLFAKKLFLISDSNYSFDKNSVLVLVVLFENILHVYL